MTEAEKLVKQSISRLKGAQTSAQREDIAEKLAYYDFDKSQLEEYLRPYIKRKDTDIPYSMTGLTEKVIDRKSVVYKKAAERRFEKKTDGDKYNEMTVEKDDSMKLIERQTNLLGRLAVKINWDENIFEYQMVRFFMPTIKMGKISQIVYEIETDLDKTRLFEVWTPEQNYIANEFGVPIKDQEEYGGNNQLINPYGELPFIYPYRKKPIEGFWVEGATDIIEANEKVNLSLTLLNYLERYASFKQPYVKGLGLKKQVLEAGYSKFLTLEGEGEIGLIDLEANLDQIIKSIQFKIELILKNHNLNCEWGGQGKANSGFQLIVENIDLLDMWKDQVDIWRKHERNLYQKEKMVYKTMTKKTLPERMDVDFAEVKFPINPEEQRAQDDWDLKHNLTSRLELAKRRSPDTPDRDLQKKLDEYAEQNKADVRIPGLEEKLRGFAP